MKFAPRSACWLAALLLVTGPGLRAAEVRSPDGRISVTVDVGKGGIPQYSMSYRGVTVMPAGNLGFRFQAQPAFDEGFRVAGSVRASHDGTWEQPWGERRWVRDHYNELLVRFESASGAARRFDLRLRVFDDGFGFRYEVPEQPGYADVNITDELTEFRLEDDDDTRAWWIPGRRYNRYEYLYNATGLDAIHLAHTPMTVRLETGLHLSFHEAALVDYAAYVLDQRRDGVFRTNLTPWSDGIRVKKRTPFTTPWRTVQVSPTAAGVLNSNLVLNLNEPNKLGDVSWVEPGKYIGIWWAMHIKQATWSSGPRHGATTAETLRYIDFAAQHGFAGVLVEGWNVGWDGDWFQEEHGRQFRFTEPYPDFDLKAVTEHARRKGVRLVGHHETAANLGVYEPQMGAAFDLYESVGVRQVKTGYVADAGDIRRIDEHGFEIHEWHDGQFTVNHHERLLREAAKRKISINTHEPVKDTGLRRTYPNWLAREGARGQEYNAWGTPPNPPEHVAILPFTRMLSGPMDYTPGIVALDGYDPKNRVQHTLAKELSLYVVLYSPIQMAADLPENYEKHPRAFQFIKDVPTDWDESIALAGEVGDYVAIARRQRGHPDWYLGALTDENSRSLSLRLDFLDPQARYVAEIYRDGPQADWQARPYDLVFEQRPVTARDTLDLRLARSGGAAIRFRKTD
jgi:alpha-glucosidase